MPDVVEINCDPELTDAEGRILPPEAPERVTERAYTAKEKTQADKDIAEGRAQADAEKAAAAQRAKDVAAVRARAKTDPDFAAVARLMGIDDRPTSPAAARRRKK